MMATYAHKALRIRHAAENLDTKIHRRVPWIRNPLCAAWTSLSMRLPTVV